MWNTLQKFYLEKNPWLRDTPTVRQVEIVTQSRGFTPILSGDIPTSTAPESQVSAPSFRNSDGRLLEHHATFTVNSGVLLWGQVLPMYRGSLQEGLTGDATVAKICFLAAQLCSTSTCTDQQRATADGRPVAIIATGEREPVETSRRPTTLAGLSVMTTSTLQKF